MAGGKKGSPSRSGVFNKPVDPLTEAFTQSISFDRVLCKYDIAGSIAHAKMLGKVGLIKRSEEETILRGLAEIQSDYDEGKINFSAEYEDIHMNVEKALEERIGETAGKLHTARSRNDQIALDERLWLRDELDEIARLIGNVQDALLDLATEYANDAMPGYTHLQRAQPVSCGHYLLAYVEMFARDKDRMSDARRRANVLPLGACALAGTSLPIDRQYVAAILGFDGVTRNSMDTTADRDYLLDFAYAMSVCSLHLSRMSEDFILYSTTEFGLLEIDDAFCTGSSIMPQKRNPDILELIRGKTGRSIALLSHYLILVKGLPLTYNRDFQEDKELLFETTLQFKGCLQIIEAVLRNLRFRRDRMADACELGYMDATALAEHLVRRGIPFRQAHHVAGKLVNLAVQKGVKLADLEIEELQSVHALLGEETRNVLGGKGVIGAYASEGSANPKFVLNAIEDWRSRLRGERGEPDPKAKRRPSKN
ncbi:MAG: argininosuccinate lyase [Planctomycetota bacterium]|nr:argininosuccinate lyase [Planctomycetota bacterium]